MSISAKIQENRSALVNKIIKDIQDAKPFFWDSGILYGAMPRKLVQALKGKNDFYKGVNHLQLSVSALEKGFKDSRWATFKQTQDLGFKIKKGSKGTTIEFYTNTVDIMEINPKTGKKEPVYVKDEKTGQMVKAVKELEFPIIKTYTVFNVEQMEGIEPEKPENIKINPEDINLDMENMIKNSEAKVYFDQITKNYYSPTTDEIHVVPKENFKAIDIFYATVAHEIAHSTGAKNRLNRKTLVENDGFGNISYAKEELRAELTSMFLAQKYNINFDENHYENHVAYLQSWIKVLKDDPNELFRAASEAEKAMQYIETNMIQLKQEQTLTQNEINNDKLTIIQRFKPKANNISTSQLYLTTAQKLLKENNNTWQENFNKKIAEVLVAKGKYSIDIQKAINKYSPIKVSAEEIKNITNKLQTTKSLTR